MSVAVRLRVQNAGLTLTVLFLSACSARSIAGNGGADLAAQDSAAPDLAGLSVDLAAGEPTGWQKQPSGTTQNLNGLWGSSATDLYAVGNAGTIVHSRGDGQWIAQTSGTTATLNAIWGSSTTDLYVAGESIVLRSSGDGHWRSETPPGASYQAVWGSGAGDVYIAGIIGLAHSTGDGTWTAQPPVQQTRGYFGLGGRSANDVWAVGGDGQQTVGQLIGGTQHFTGSWSWIALGSTQNMKGIVLTTHGTFIVGNGGEIWFDGGNGFQRQTSAVVTDLNSVWAAGSGTLFAVGGSGAVVTSSGDGAWHIEATPSALPLNAVWGASETDVYTVGYAGEILHRQ
jgi:hypothetical protein